MKLRIHGNSLRLRLNRAEVAELADKGRVESSIEFSPWAKLSYSVEVIKDLAAAGAVCLAGDIRVQVPENDVREWAKTERVEIAAEQPLGDGRRLSILVEKDFQCMHKEGEEDVEAFPNPLAARN